MEKIMKLNKELLGDGVYIEYIDNMIVLTKVESITIEDIPVDITNTISLSIETLQKVGNYLNAIETLEHYESQGKTPKKQISYRPESFI
jgi:hypothetical protein